MRPCKIISITRRRSLADWLPGARIGYRADNQSAHMYLHSDFSFQRRRPFGSEPGLASFLVGTWRTCRAGWLHFGTVNSRRAPIDIGICRYDKRVVFHCQPVSWQQNIRGARTFFVLHSHSLSSQIEPVQSNRYMRQQQQQQLTIRLPGVIRAFAKHRAFTQSSQVE